VRRLFQSPVDSQIFQRGKFAYEGGQVLEVVAREGETHDGGRSAALRGFEPFVLRNFVSHGDGAGTGRPPAAILVGAGVEVERAQEVRGEVFQVQPR